MAALRPAISPAGLQRCGIHAAFLGMGGAFGNYSADARADRQLADAVSVHCHVSGQHYRELLRARRPGSSSNQFNVTWDGATLLAQSDIPAASPIIPSMSSAIRRPPATPLAFTYQATAPACSWTRSRSIRTTNPPTETRPAISPSPTSRHPTPIPPASRRRATITSAPSRSTPDRIRRDRFGRPGTSRSTIRTSSSWRRGRR